MIELFIIIFILLLSATYAFFRGAPWVPMWKKDIVRFLELAKIKPGEKVYDLGCGDGRLLSASAKKGANAIGVEISIFPYFLAYLRKILSKNKFKLVFNDFWFVNISDADVVYFFLMPEFCEKIKPKLEKELKKGTRVVSYVWPIKDWEPVEVSRADKRPDLYLYEI